MKYDIKYSCGHEGVVELYGEWEYREKMLSYYQNNPCPECFKAEQNKIREKKLKEKTEEKSEILKHFNPCKLLGTPRQVLWGEDIRMNIIEKAYKEGISTDILLVAYLCYTKKEATFYIDMRFCKSYHDVLVKNKYSYIKRGVILPNERILKKAKEMKDFIYFD